MNEILISGYYGFKNSGDDALLMSIITDIKKRKPDSHIVVLSKNPAETRQTYNVGAISRTNIACVFYHMLRARLLISGGGTLIQDATSTKSLIYYLGVIAIAKLMGLKIMLYANGIGPLTHENNRVWTGRILNRADIITLRDEKSAEVLNEIGVNKPRITITSDPVFLINPALPEVGNAILKDAGVPEGKKCIGISIRSWKQLSEDFETELVESVRYATDRYGLFPVFLPMQPKDMEISERVGKKLSCEYVILDKKLTAEEELSVVGQFCLTIGMRLHMLIYAAAQGVPVIGLVYDPKVSGFMDYAKQSLYMNAQTVDRKKIMEYIDTIMSDHVKICDELSEIRSIMRERAELNGEIASELFEKRCPGK